MWNPKLVRMMSGGLALGRVECGLLEFGNGLALGDRRIEATILRAAGIFRVLLRQLGEIGARLQLLLDILGLCLRSFHTLGIDLAVRSGRRRLNQDVADGNGLRNAEFVLMLVVIRLEIGLRDRDRSGQLGRINNDVTRLALLGNGVHDTAACSGRKTP